MDIDAVSISDLFGISKSIFFFPTWTSNLAIHDPRAISAPFSKLMETLDT